MIQLGVSLYPEQETPEQIEEYLTLARKYGFTKIFTSLFSVQGEVFWRSQELVLSGRLRYANYMDRDLKTPVTEMPNWTGNASIRYNFRERIILFDLVRRSICRRRLINRCSAESAEQRAFSEFFAAVAAICCHSILLFV